MRRDRSRKPRRKVCSFCVDHAEQIDYKDVAKLRRFTTERGKILPRRISGVCAKTSAQTDGCYQTGQSYRSASVYGRLI